VLQQRGALRFAELERAVGGFPREVESALWALVWSGEVTNDTLTPLRSRLRGASRDRVSPRRALAPHRRTSPGTEGRWSWVPPCAIEETTRRAARAAQALTRDGVVVREAVDDFGALYPVLKAMEDAGRVRRGYFVEGLGATQFSQPGTEERLRAFREPEAGSVAVVLPACDPANPWGTALPWPRRESGRPMRAAGTQVVLHDGHLRAWLGRNGRALSTFLPEDPPARHRAAEAIATALSGAVDAGQLPGFTLVEVDGAAPGSSPLASALLRSGFSASAAGFVRRRTSTVRGGAPSPIEAERA
jgi:ATP-dependent Lhr-like helicase